MLNSLYKSSPIRYVAPFSICYVTIEAGDIFIRISKHMDKFYATAYFRSFTLGGIVSNNTPIRYSVWSVL